MGALETGVGGRLLRFIDNDTGAGSSTLCKNGTALPNTKRPRMDMRVGRRASTADSGPSTFWET